MQELKKWGKDKPFLISIFAAELVSTVQDMAEESKTIKLHRFARKKFPQPPLPVWFKLYRHHRVTEQTVQDVCTAAMGRSFGKLVSKFQEEMQKLRRSKQECKPTEEEIKEAIDLLQWLQDASYKDLEDEFTGKPARVSSKNRMAKLIEKKPIEISFYLFVAVPCWTLYRTSPTELYRKARQGDFESLEKLLRLDQLMLHDPAIGKQVIAYRFKHSSSKYRRLLGSASKPPKGSGSKKNILLSQVGLISALSHLTAKPLTPQDIFELVDAYDHDSKSNFLAEFSSPGALARDLSPDRNMWRKVFSPVRQKKQTSVSDPTG